VRHCAVRLVVATFARRPLDPPPFCRFFPPSSFGYLGESHPRVATGIKKNVMMVRENFGNHARLIIRENFGNLIAAVSI
jgi:hypothetical protein